MHTPFLSNKKHCLEKQPSFLPKEGLLVSFGAKLLPVYEYVTI
jgi:hypothetical protein